MLDMENKIIIGLILFILLTIIFIVIKLSIIGLKYISRKGFGTIFLLILFIIIGLIGLRLFFEFHPTNRFFVKTFKEYTNCKFPDSWVLTEYKYRGPFAVDYIEKATFKIDKQECVDIINQLKQNKLFQLEINSENTDKISSSYFKVDDALYVFSLFDTDRIYDGDKFEISISKDSTTMRYYLHTD
jgi:hypothetical protein